MAKHNRIIAVMVSTLWSAAILSLSACSSMDSMSGSAAMSKASTPKDGDLALPADYKAWPSFC